MKNKLMIIMLSILLLGVVVVGLFIFLPYYKDINQFGMKVSGIDEIATKEKKFEKYPSPELAFHLMEKYKHVETIRDNKKVKFYGEQALKLGADKKPCSFYINIWLASIYRKEGANKKACRFYRKAIQLQDPEKNNVINEQLLKEEGLDNVFVDHCQ